MSQAGSQAQVTAALSSYARELEAMLTRFRRASNGIHMNHGDEGRYREIVLELRDLFDDVFVEGSRHSRPLIAYFNESVENYLGTPSYRGVDNVRTVVSSALVRVQRSPLVLRSSSLPAADELNRRLEIVPVLARRLHRVARQLRDRRAQRSTLDVSDEYDLQDLVHVLLTIEFDDIRREEWSPTYAGGASRMDFLLPEIGSVVEMKMARPSLSTRLLGEQLIVDIAKYKKHPDCRRLFCIVYDPLGHVSNPRGVENDLNTEDEQMVVRVMIVPE